MIGSAKRRIGIIWGHSSFWRRERHGESYDPPEVMIRHTPMSHRRSIALLILIASLAHGQPAEERDWRNYPDYSALRQEIGWSDDFSARCEHDRPIESIVSLMNDEKWRDAIAVGMPWLEKCPIDIRLHYYVAISYSELGSEPEAETHLQWFKGLMDSVVATGDGKTPQTPYVTVSVDEEYDALYFFGLKVTGQSLVQGVALLDAFTAENEEGKEFTIYFSPAAHFARLEKLLR